MERADGRQNPRKTNETPLAMKRVAAGMTQKELAEKTGVSVRTLVRYERGERSPRMDEAQVFAGVLGCRVEEIMGAQAQEPVEELLAALADRVAREAHSVEEAAAMIREAARMGVASTGEKGRSNITA